MEWAGSILVISISGNPFNLFAIGYIYIQFNYKTHALEVNSSRLLHHIEEAKNGNQIAFNFLLDRFWNDVYGFQLKRIHNEADAEDITIQAFSRAFDKIDTFDDSYSFKTWLITISKNIHIDLVRKKNVRFQTTSEDDKKVYSIPDDAPSIEDILITEQNLAQLLRDIKKLKLPYQEVINLRYFQEMSYKEISQTLMEPMNNIKVKLLRAKKLLAEIITNRTG